MPAQQKGQADSGHTMATSHHLMLFRSLPHWAPTLVVFTPDEIRSEFNLCILNKIKFKQRNEKSIQNR